MPAKNTATKKLTLRQRANKRLLTENMNLRQAVLSLEARNKKLMRENKQMQQATAEFLGNARNWCQRLNSCADCLKEQGGDEELSTAEQLLVPLTLQ